MEHIIVILLYNSFIELPESNQTFEEKQEHFKLPRARQAGRKQTCYIMRSQQELEKVYGENKRKQRHCVKSHYTKDIFALFALE